jgi:predicted O-linked N-acetylglucosamine transferase (SPINDLY family)
LIHNDAIHILIDLSGHTAHNRLSVFAWKPAPIQITWLGYFATTGIAEMDYILVDEVGVPKINQWHFTEKVRYLPDTRLCFSAPTFDITASALPALSNGYLTFGCFQYSSKVTKTVLKF